MQAWLTVNQHAIPAGSQDAVGTVLSRLKGPKAGPFAQVRLTQAAQGTYTWDRLVSDVEGLSRTTNKKDWARKELRELKQGKLTTDDFIVVTIGTFSSTDLALLLECILSYRDT